MTDLPEPTFAEETEPVPVCEMTSLPTILLYVKVVETSVPSSDTEPLYILLAAIVIGLRVISKVCVPPDNV